MVLLTRNDVSGIGLVQPIRLVVHKAAAVADIHGVADVAHGAVEITEGNGSHEHAPLALNENRIRIRIAQYCDLVKFYHISIGLLTFSHRTGQHSH